MPATILVADDDSAIRTVLHQALARAGYDVRTTGTAAGLWKMITAGEGSLAITDVVLPDESGFELIPRIKRIRPDLPILVMSAQNTLLTAITAAERGAFEYLPKPFDLKELTSVVSRALASPQGRRDDSVEAAEERLPLIGRSPAMQEIYRVIARLTQTDLTVMIMGESGTGKELVARALHDYGKRRHGTFVAVNMAAIPKELVESELFGHERGAFTGATNRGIGRWKPRRGFCVCCSRANTPRWAAAPRSGPMCASSPPPTATCANSSARACSAKTFIIASTSCRCACRRCASGWRIFPTWCATSCARPKTRACRTRPWTMTRSIFCAAIAGPAMCANWKI